ncbi:hypothetical protein NFI96_000637 [Prochilodus magdalenae]|nr:hypothetical protein NFI96_000637 [Prochilodus magdalenae]
MPGGLLCPSLCAQLQHGKWNNPIVIPPPRLHIPAELGARVLRIVAGCRHAATNRSRAVREAPSISPPPAPSHDSFVEETRSGEFSEYLQGTMDQSWPVRVIVGENDIRKVTPCGRTHNVEEFITKLKNQLNLQFDFMFHYEDPDFNNAFCNLTDISELPNRATLKIIALESVFLTLSSASTMSSGTLSSASSSDTEIVPRSELTLREQWPSTFEVPSFSVDIEYRLRQGNQIYMRDGKLMSVSRDMKHDILQKLAEEMYKYSAYPQDEHFTEVAKALISKHPCLAEPG